jgi:hypothetical protein
VQSLYLSDLLLDEQHWQSLSEEEQKRGGNDFGCVVFTFALDNEEIHFHNPDRTRANKSLAAQNHHRNPEKILQAALMLVCTCS